mgnify:FL=1
MEYEVLQVVLKEEFFGTGSKNLTDLEIVLNRQARRGYRLHTMSTTSSGSKGLLGGDRIQATLIFEKNDVASSISNLDEDFLQKLSFLIGELTPKVAEIKSDDSYGKNEERHIPNNNYSNDDLHKPETGYLININEQNFGECSNCGQKQKLDRKVCYNCGVKFEV